MDKLVLIDGNSLLNRAFYATPVFSTSSGQPTNAIFGFIKLLFKIFGDINPQYIIVAFDLKAPTFRHKMFDGYKANRSPMPEELASQVEPLKSLLSAMGIATCEKEGYEADDIIGTLSEKFDVHSYIYTGDRDSFQLVDGKTDVYFTKRGVSDLQKLSADNFKQEVGLSPAAIVDLKALMGDKSDNIPGVFGIGEKSARNLLEEYGTLDGVYENVDGIKSASVRQKLKEHKQEAYLSYQLATIKRDCDLDIALENCKVPSSYSDEVKQLFAQFEFKTFLAMDIFDGQTDYEAGAQTAYPPIEKLSALGEVEELFRPTGDYFIDLHSDRASVYFGGVQYDIEYSKTDDLLSNLSYNCFCDSLSAVFANAGNKVVLFDYKKFLHEIKDLNFSINCDVDDLSVLKYLADHFDKSDNLEDLCVIKGFDGAYSAYLLKKFYDEYCEALHSEGTWNLYEDIEKPLIGVLFDMEVTGVKVDVSQIDALGKKYSAKINELREKIFDLCDYRFNLNSPTQLGDVLYTKMGLKLGKKSKSGKYSTSAEILEKLADEHEVVRLILQYRQFQKLYSTYIEGFKPLIGNADNLVHTTFNQTVTTTGRLSSTNPNLQNIPVREEEGRELRKVFVPREGNVLIDADYTQIELRLLAHFSGCKELIEAYRNDEDIHTVTASQVFNVPREEVTAKMRRDAKAVNFGIIYGISDFGLAKNLNIDVKVAREYIEKYFAQYSAVKEYMESNVEFARANGYVSTLTGRKRYIREINSSNYNLRQFGERAAMNMPLQGSSADIIKIAMVNLGKKLQSEGMRTKLILQVHDELILDAPKDEMDKAAEMLRSEMENAVQLKVPLKVEIAMGRNWYEAK